MIRKPSFRLFLLLNALLLVAWSLIQVPNAEADPCSACRRACIAEYRDCLSWPLAGCDGVFTDCVAVCPCP